MALKWVFSSVFPNLLSHTADEAENQQKSSNAAPKMSDNINKGTDESFQFQMPLHYPRYTKKDYESMEEWKLNLLLQEYGLGHFTRMGCCTLEDKRSFAMGAFLWPDQL